jgi:two-component system cell cycle sensor histidine kinase/response regulator CckA
MMAMAFAEASQRHERRTILLVEDEAFVRKVAAEVLELAGFKLIIAGSAREALEACDRYSEPVDLLISDVVMPGMSGRELAAEFKNLFPKAQILLMTGYSDQLASFERSTFDNKYIAKPFSIATLLSRVREALATTPHDSFAQA